MADVVVGVVDVEVGLVADVVVGGVTGGSDTAGKVIVLDVGFAVGCVLFGGVTAGFGAVTAGFGLAFGVTAVGFGLAFCCAATTGACDGGATVGGGGTGACATVVYEDAGC